MYTTRNFKSKKALKDALKNGDAVEYYQPGPFGGTEQTDGEITLEGPHFPKPHTWYARAKVSDGLVVKLL